MGKVKEEDQPILVLYTNYKGNTGVRKIIPINIRFGNSSWHQEPQYLLKAYDLERKEEREFALKDCNFLEKSIQKYEGLKN